MSLNGNLALVALGGLDENASWTGMYAITIFDGVDELLHLNKVLKLLSPRRCTVAPGLQVTATSLSETESRINNYELAGADIWILYNQKRAKTKNSLAINHFAYN